MTECLFLEKSSGWTSIIEVSLSLLIGLIMNLLRDMGTHTHRNVASSRYIGKKLRNKICCIDSALGRKGNQKY